MLEMKSVSRLAGREAVFQQTSLTFLPGTLTTLLGLSPIGRTAALRLIGGVDRPDAGAVFLEGRDPRRRDGGKRFAWVRRDGAPASGRSVSKTLRLAAAGKSGDAELARLASRAGLADRLDARTRDLDLDQRLRLAFACGLAARPAVVLLDAPFRDLPRDARARLLADLSGMVADRDAIVVLAAELPDEALALGGNVVVLVEGRVVQEGAPAFVLAHPRNLRAALATAFPGLNTLGVDLADGTCRLADGSTFHPPRGLALPGGGKATLALRPDDLSFERQCDLAVRFVVRTDGEETIAGRRLARVRFADARWLVPKPNAEAAPGMVLSVFVDPGRIMVFDAAGGSVEPPPG